MLNDFIKEGYNKIAEEYNANKNMFSNIFYLDQINKKL